MRRLPECQIGIAGELWLRFDAGNETFMDVSVRSELNGFADSARWNGRWKINSIRLDIESLAKLTAACAARLDFMLEELSADVEVVRRVQMLLAQGGRQNAAAGKE